MRRSLTFGIEAPISSEAKLNTFTPRNIILNTTFQSCDNYVLFTFLHYIIISVDVQQLNFNFMIYLLFLCSRFIFHSIACDIYTVNNSDVCNTDSVQYGRLFKSMLVPSKQINYALKHVTVTFYLKSNHNYMRTNLDNPLKTDNNFIKTKTI